MPTTSTKWDLAHLHTHLQYAVDLEFWTVPYYLSAMYSIKDPSTDAYQLIQSVAFQEMLHIQLASNIANAYGYSPSFDAPTYQGKTIPHLDFNLDTPDPTTIYQPYTAQIGPLDVKRINTMCLIEYPEWRTGHPPDPEADVKVYGSIGEFYAALEIGARQLSDHIQGNLNQVDYFQHFYNNFENPIVTQNGSQGLLQVMDIFFAITEQGEGQTSGEKEIAKQYQNTTDDIAPQEAHFRKFTTIRSSNTLPETYTGVLDPEPNSPGAVAQQTLINSFKTLRETLTALFSGQKTDAFGAQMATVGGHILACWQKGAIPKFS